MQKRTKLRSNRNSTTNITVGGQKMPVSISQLKGWKTAHGVASNGSQVNSLSFIQAGDTTFVNNNGKKTAFKTDELEVLMVTIFPNSTAKSASAISSK